MNFYVWWIVSIIGSFGMEMQNYLRLYKDIADEGYNLNTKFFSKERILQLLIPGLNVFKALKNAYDYNKNKFNLFYLMNSMGIVEEMSKEEKKKYEKKPSGFNALLISAEHYAVSIDITVNSDGKNMDEFINKILDGDFKINNIEGSMSNLTEEQQKRKIKELVKEQFGQEYEISSNEMKTELSESINNRHKELSEQKQQLEIYRKLVASLKEDQHNVEQEDIKKR